jgi:hypothetical protein
MTRATDAASSHRLRVSFAMLAALVFAFVGCGSGNTGSLDLFSPPRQKAGPNGVEDARTSGAGGQPVMPPGPGCPDGGCASDECRSDGDCHSGSASRCDTASSRCVECLGDPDCADGERVLCDSASHACVECLGDSDCTDPSKPGCFTPTGRCEECSTDTHCSGGQTCDQSDGHCR